jgi:hypothetical protein
LVPSVFRHHGNTHWAYVHRQPATPEEARLCLEAVAGCPTDSIGTEGDQLDRLAAPPDSRSLNPV